MSTHPDPSLAIAPERPRTTWTADELMVVSFPEPTWAVPGLIAEGLSVLAGAPKVGKSWLSLGLGVCIAAGLPALGSMPVQAGPVLYLALEDTPRRLQTRLRKILAGYPAPAGLTLNTHCPPLPGGGDAYIAGWLDENPGARLVVIDVFTKVRGTPPPGATSAYEADYAAVGRAKRLADTYGVPLVLVHHVRKATAEDFLATVSGTHGLAGAADTVLVLERPRATAHGVLHVTGRDVDETDYPLSFDPAAGAWSLLDGPPEDYLLRDTRALISRYLREHPGAKPAHIATALALAPATVRQACARMATDGQLRTEPGGHYYPAASSDSSCDTPELSHLSLCHSTPSELQEHL